MPIAEAGSKKPAMPTVVLTRKWPVSVAAEIGRPSSRSATKRLGQARLYPKRSMALRTGSGEIARQPFAIGRRTQCRIGLVNAMLPRLKPSIGSGMYCTIEKP